MGETITRDSLLQYFIDSCDLLEGYEKIFHLIESEVHKDETKVEGLLNDYREYQNIDGLIPMLIILARYYSDSKANNLAVIYLIECQCILENLETDCSLKAYIFAELGYIYEIKGMFEESKLHYQEAISLANKLRLPIVSTYAFERLIRVMLGNGSSIEEIGELPILIPEEVEPFSTQMDLLKAYKIEDYQAIIEEKERLNLSEDKVFLMQKVIWTYSLAQLKRPAEIKWDFTLLSMNPLVELDIYVLLYHLTYHLVYDCDKELYDYASNLIEDLRAKNQFGWLDFIYQILANSKRIQLDEKVINCVEKGARESALQVYYQQQRLLSRTDGVYHNYQNYYSGLDLNTAKRKYKVVNWEQFSMAYQQDYSSKTTMGYFKLDECFYKDFNYMSLKEIVVMIDEFIDEVITFSVEKDGIWFYFETNCGEVKLKRKLNRLAERCYDALNKSYFVSFCLPKLTSPCFEETVEHIRANFYGMIFKPIPKLLYQVNFCQGKFTRYNLYRKIHELIEQANQTGKFDLGYRPLFYHEDEQLFGIECENLLDDSIILNQIPNEDREEAAFVLNIEKEIYLFKLGCEYLKNYYEEKDVKLSLFIKFSRSTLLNKCLSSHIISYLGEFGVDPTQVIISVNEDILFEENEWIQKTIERLRNFGINIALDEYGTGALTGSIRNLSIDYLRISSSFIQYLKSSKNCLSMFSALVNVCMSKDVKICCSEIESESNLHVISDFGIDVVGGSYYQRKLVV